MEVVLTSLSGGLCLNVSFGLHLLLKFWLLLPCLMLLGVFEMSHSGLQADSNASEMFLSEQLLDSEILVGLAVAVVMDGSWTFLMEIQEVYRQIVDEKLSSDSEGNPFKMLVFRGSPKSRRKSIHHIDEMRAGEAATLQNTSNQHHYRRSLPKIRIMQGQGHRIATIAWNGQILTSGSHDKYIINHDVRARNNVISQVKAHKAEVCGLKWTRGNILDHCAAVKALAWCPYDSSVLASGGGTEDRSIKLWNVKKVTSICSIDTKAQVCGLECNRHHK